MKRRLWAAALVIGLAGCFDDQLDRSGTSYRGQPVELPAVSEASVATAARVDQIGRQLVSRSLFLGVDPVFRTLGRKDPEVFHPDPNSLYVTEGLVERCKTDDELAAVLAVELGKMSAERRAADRMRRPDPLHPLPEPGTVGVSGGTSDQNQLGTQALFDQKLGRPRNPKPAAPEDPRKQAADILKSAGIDPKALDAVAPLMDEASRHHDAADQFGGRPAKPTWSN